MSKTAYREKLYSFGKTDTSPTLFCESDNPSETIKRVGIHQLFPGEWEMVSFSAEQRLIKQQESLAKPEILRSSLKLVMSRITHCHSISVILINEESGPKVRSAILREAESSDDFECIKMVSPSY